MATDLQKAGVMKRLSAFMLDLIIFILIASAVASLASWAIGYRKTTDAWNSHYQQYEEAYGVPSNLTEEEYKNLSPAERNSYDEMMNELFQDEQTFQIERDLLIKTVLVVAISLLVTFALTEVLVPLLFKNGQTLGKKAFAIGVIRIDCVRITPFQVVVRAIFGKCLMETMLPALLLVMSPFNRELLLALVVAAVLLIFQIVLLIVTKTNSTIHDSVAVTVVVDMQTQMIFDTPEELMEYQKRLAAEEAERQSY